MAQLITSWKIFKKKCQVNFFLSVKLSAMCLIFSISGHTWYWMFLSTWEFGVAMWFVLTKDLSGEEAPVTPGDI